MAEKDRTVRVSGLPPDIDEERLRDKLFIHFLRCKNGGGEIESVTIVKATPFSALITFEDRRVAQSVIQHSRHILEVDGKKYNVIVTENHCESLDPDKVIQSLSAVVDHSQLPGGFIALANLYKSHPEILISCDDAVNLYTLKGTYSKVQAALAQLLGHHESPISGESNESGQSDSSGLGSVEIAQKRQTHESEDKSRRPTKQRQGRDQVHIGRSSNECNPGSHPDMTPGSDGLKDTDQIEGAALQCHVPPTTSEEDFLVIVDADMFHYVQKHCIIEYQQILSQNGVDVVDMTNQGLTSLFLQVATGVVGQDQECLKLARKAISSFFQENETKILRDHLPKSILSPSWGLQRVKEKLSVRLPKLLLNEDDQNVYIIGTSSDVSQAKWFLLKGYEVWPRKEDAANLLRFPSFDLGPSTHSDEQQVSLKPSCTSVSLDDRVDELLRSDENEKRAEGAGKYKLAARFKDSGLAALGNRPTAFSLGGTVLSPSRQTRIGPLFGSDVFSDTADNVGVRASRALAQTSGGDILKTKDTMTSNASVQNKTQVNSSKSHPSTSQFSLSVSTPVQQVSGSKLKRTHSFSGMPQQKTQVVGQKRQEPDDTSNSAVRTGTRSSSFSNQTRKDNPGGYNAEITVSSLMWQHTKEAYGARVDDLTSDVQVKQSPLEDSKDLILTLRGAKKSKVMSCQLGLQKLLESVSADFSLHELHLSELGITDTADETLQACCTELRSRYKKVTIQILKKNLYLFGPEQLCSQVGASLWEIFSGHTDDLQDFATSITSKGNLSTFSLMNKDQSTTLHCSNNPQKKPGSQSSKSNETVQERRTNHESELMKRSISQPSVMKDPVIKDKEKIGVPAKLDVQKIETFVNRSKTENDKGARHVISVGSTKSCADDLMGFEKDSIQREMGIDIAEEFISGLRSHGCVCVCGASEQLIRTKCGATMCSKCLDSVPVHCIVCHVNEPIPWCIQGKISYSNLHISIPGHQKDSAIKINYCIPDGIQEEGHPSPGKPFRGGFFEAFLPDCEKARKMLPRLEKAFKQGLTFTVVEKETGSSVTWDRIPHKTSLHGGKSGNGYPDSTYLTRLSEVLTSHGIEDQPAMF